MVIGFDATGQVARCNYLSNLDSLGDGACQASANDDGNDNRQTQREPNTMSNEMELVWIRIFNAASSASLRLFVS